MKISVKWLGEYVALPASVDELARKLTAVGLEIEGMERPGEGLRGVVVAQIKESVQHPNADKLSVTQVDIGASALLLTIDSTGRNATDPDFDADNVVQWGCF